MDIIETIYNNKINGFSILELLNLIENNTDTQAKNSLMLKKQGKLINVKCICNLYCEIGSNKKFKPNTVNNPCHKITKAFNIDTNFSYNCSDCHRQMIDKLLKGEVNLYGKKN